MANTVYEIREAANSDAPPPGLQGNEAAQLARQALAAPANIPADGAEAPAGHSCAAGRRPRRSALPWLPPALVLAAGLLAHWSIDQDKQRLSALEHRLSARRAGISLAFKQREARLEQDEQALGEQAKQSEEEKNRLEQQAAVTAAAWSAAIERMNDLAYEQARHAPVDSNAILPGNIEKPPEEDNENIKSQSWQIDSIQQQFHRDRLLAAQPYDGAKSPPEKALDLDPGYGPEEVIALRRALRSRPLSISDPTIHVSNPALGRW